MKQKFSAGNATTALSSTRADWPIPRAAWLAEPTPEVQTSSGKVHRHSRAKFYHKKIISATASPPLPSLKGLVLAAIL